MGPGFDKLGMALQFYNYFQTEAAETLSVELSPFTCVETPGFTPHPDENLLAQAYQAYFRYRNLPLIPAKLSVEAHIPFSRGLGSSSTAIVGGMVLANLMTSNPLPKENLLPWVIDIEGHPDNVTPALLGGLRRCDSNKQQIELQWPTQWGFIAVIPPTPLSTHQAREALPKTYSPQDIETSELALKQWQEALQAKDFELFSQALQGDRLHQPYRGKLIPEYAVLLKAVENTPVKAAVYISGSGSTLAVVTTDKTQNKATINHLKQDAMGLGHCKIISLQPDYNGATVEEASKTPKTG